MAITKSGIFYEDNDTGFYSYGEGGFGSLTVDNGSGLVLRASDPGVEPFLRSGFGLEGSSGGQGEIRITGTGSRVKVQAEGSTIQGAGAIVGVYNSTGLFSITDGAFFEIVDGSRIPLIDDLAGSEFFVVGAFAQSEGQFIVDRGSFSMRGGDPYLDFGRQGGTGTGTITNKSSVLVKSIAESSAYLQVGRDAGSQGMVMIDESSVIIQSHADSRAGILVGLEGAAGSLTVQNNALVDIKGGVQSAYADIGWFEGGNGTLRVEHSTLKLSSSHEAAVHIGRQGDDQGSVGAAHFVDNARLLATSGNFSGMVIGGERSEGVATFSSGSSAIFEGGSAFISVGFKGVDYSGGIGQLVVDSARIELKSTVTNAGLNVGEVTADGSATLTNGAVLIVDAAQIGGAAIGFGDGNINIPNQGELTISDKAAATFRGASGAYVNVGEGKNSRGTLTVDNASVTVDGSLNAASFEVGLESGSGRATLRNNAHFEVISQDVASVKVGGSNQSNLTLENGASLALEAIGASSSARIEIGADSGNSQLSVSDATLRITSDTTGTLLVGTSPIAQSEESGWAQLDVRKGGQVLFESLGRDFFDIGGNGGRVQVVEGGKIDMDIGDTDSGLLNIGTTFGHGMLDISGSGSIVRGLDRVIVGQDPAAKSTGVALSSKLGLHNGGTISGKDLEIILGKAGVLYSEAEGGRVIGDLALYGGRIDLLGLDPSLLEVDHDLTIRGAGNQIILGEGRDFTSKVHVKNDVGGDGFLTFIIYDPLLTEHSFDLGYRQTLLEIGGENNLHQLAGMDLDVVGRQEDFSYALGYLENTPSQVIFETLSSSFSGGPGILDFQDDSSSVANLVYDSTAGRGEASGGQYLDSDKLLTIVYNVDVVLGTFGSDIFRVSGDKAHALSISGRGGNDAIRTGDADDELKGDSGNDSLDGGKGADRMEGGSGNDVFQVDNKNDQVIEAKGQGTDTVKASVSFSLRGQSAENLILTGTTDINATGNKSANVLTGNKGDNRLSGFEGADTLKGGKGDDTYIVDNRGDKVVEAKNAGADTVKSSVDFSLKGQSLETLILTGDRDIDGTGTSGANVITGNGGDNVLDGGAGNDALTGGAGGDRFLFSTKLNAQTNVDTLVDFSVKDDSIRLDQDVFAGLVTGKLEKGSFFTGEAAQTDDHRLIYDDDTGALSFDRDGEGGTAAVRFATLGLGLALTNGDFLIV